MGRYQWLLSVLWQPCSHNPRISHWGAGDCVLAASTKTPQVVIALLLSLGLHQMSLLAHLKEGSIVLLGTICAVYSSV